MRIVRTALYLRCLKKLGASAEDVTNAEAAVIANPLAGDVIPSMRGIRKIRFAMRGKGKRGGGRAIYYVVWNDDLAYMIFAYSKAMQEDLSARQRELALEIVEALKRGKA